eukprot:14831074-Alexandrium_andersonii.AAC.1
MQHQTDLLLRPITVELQLLSPLFCLVKQLRDSGHMNSLQSAAKQLVARELAWIQSGDGPPPNPSHAERNRVLLERTYYARNIDELPASEREGAQADDRVR